MWSSTPDALREALAEAEELSTEQLEVEIRGFLTLSFGWNMQGMTLDLDELVDFFIVGFLECLKEG